jgi:2-polyprenyl-3-methyl-5-hydroxy-6-metoxy-1,4-benzoquinol methylase
MSPQPGQPTPEKITRFAWGYVPPLVLEAAVRNGIFDAIDGGAETVADVCAKTGISERGARAIMDALAGMELLVKSDGVRYALSPEAATFLVSRSPTNITGMAARASSMMAKWLALSDIVRTGRPERSLNSEAEGAEFFEGLVTDLFPMNYGAARAAAEKLGVSASSEPVRVLDLAAGSGVWSIAIAQRSPNVTVTAVDWPGVLEVTRRTAARFGLADRYSFVAGDLAEADFGSGHNIATLGHILHSEGEERSRALLKKTFHALAPGGTAVIAEFLVNADRSGPLQGLIFNINMLVNSEHGATFSFEEIRGWMEQTGFKDVRTVDAPSPSPLIFATRPS